MSTEGTYDEAKLRDLRETRVVGASVQHTRFPVDCAVTANVERALCLNCAWQRDEDPHGAAVVHAATFDHRALVSHIEMFMYRRAPVQEVK